VLFAGLRDRRRPARAMRWWGGCGTCPLAAPASANTVAKLALGIADNQALTQVNEAIGVGDLPVVVFPRVNAAHARHPSWERHIDALRCLGPRCSPR
jgi:flavoprotein